MQHSNMADCKSKAIIRNVIKVIEVKYICFLRRHYFIEGTDTADEQTDYSDTDSSLEN